MQFNEYAINEVVQELGATINDFREPFDFCKDAKHALMQIALVNCVHKDYSKNRRQNPIIVNQL